MEFREGYDMIDVFDRIICWAMMFSYCVLLKIIMSIESMTSERGHAFCLGGKDGKEVNITKFTRYHQDI